MYGLWVSSFAETYLQSAWKSREARLMELNTTTEHLRCVEKDNCMHLRPCACSLSWDNAPVLLALRYPGQGRSALHERAGQFSS